MKNRSIVGVFVLLIIGAVFGAVLVSSYGWVRPSYGKVNIGASNPPIEQADSNAVSFQKAFMDVAEQVNPSIVQITVVSQIEQKMPENFDFFFPFKDKHPRKVQAGGSGIIISEDGYILTNNHVVEEATKVEVALYDKREFDAKVVGTDPLTDLAVVKIDAENLPNAHLGNSDNIEVGQWVMALGNPLSLTSTVTAGIISAKNRSLNLIKDSYGVENYIQTDAVINKGNSGGALVNLNGSVIGINSAIATSGMSDSYIGYGFAIPINLAKGVAKDLIAHGKVTRGYIGVQIDKVTSAVAKAVGLDKPRGVLIQGVVEDGAAAEKDIKAGDIILKVNDKEVNKPNELQSFVASKKAGTEVKLTLFRDGEKIERYVTLKGRDTEKTEEAKDEKEESKEKDVDKLQEATFENLGMAVRDLKSSEYKRYEVDNGIIITDVEKYSKAYDQRLFRGLVITEADRKPVESVAQFKEIIESKKGEAVLLKVMDDEGTSRYVGLEIN